MMVKKKQRWDYYAYLAVICWLVSLACPFFIWDNLKPSYGWEVLVFGFVPFFIGIIVWVANLFFFSTCLRIFKELGQWDLARTLLKFFLGIYVLILCLFGIASIEMHSFHALGYGVGFVLWVLSLVLMFLAFVTKNGQKKIIEKEKDEGSNVALKRVTFWGEVFLLGTCAAIIVYSVLSFVQIRTTASDDEKERLNQAVISVESLCTKNVPRITQSLPHDVYVVDYQDNQETEQAMEMVKDLLTSGATAVQYKGEEFYLNRLKHGESLIYFVSPTHEANLRVMHQVDKLKGIRTLSIFDLKNNVLLFENEWKKISRSRERLGGAAKECPQWTFYDPDGGYYLNAFKDIFLDLFDGREANEIYSKGWTQTLDYTYKGEWRAKESLTPSQLALFEINPLSRTYSCPSDVGWLTEKSRNVKGTRFVEKYLRVQQRTYYSTFYYKNLYCTPEYLYFYKFCAGGKEGRLFIDKRHASDLNIVWGGSVNFPFPDNREEKQWYQLRVVGLEESNSQLTLTLIDPATGFRGELKADLISSK